MPERHLDLTLAEWLAELSVAWPAPASGSTLAYAVASAAALLVKSAHMSVNEEGSAAQASALLERAAELVQRDADAYEQALAVRATVTELPTEKQDWEVGRAYAAAAEPPLEIARIAADVAELAATLVTGVDARVEADATAAAFLAAGAARGAVALVAANLTATHDDPRIAEAERLAQIAEDTARRTVTA